MKFTIGTDPEFEIIDTAYGDAVSADEIGIDSYHNVIGTDCGAMEIRFPVGYSSVEAIMKDSEYWINKIKYMSFYEDRYTDMCCEDAYYELHGNDCGEDDMKCEDCDYEDYYAEGREIDIDVFSGSGDSMSLGGHLHAVFQYPVFGNSSPFSNSYTLDKMLSLVGVPLSIAEHDRQKAWNRYRDGYGSMFCRNTQKHHIEYRKPFSFFHSKELAEGVFGIWGWWCELIQAISTKQLSFDRVSKLIDRSVMAIVPMYIHEDYNRYDEETAFFEKYSMFENLFKYDVDIYQRLSERLYNKWAKYFLPMFDRILGKGYPESRSVLTEWRSDLCQKYTPKYKYEECSSCNSRMDVGHKEMTESGEYICTRCTGSYKELYEL